jgi:hypothetical protein
MAYTPPLSDLARSRQHDPNRVWPEAVKIAVHWKDAAGRLYIKTEVISASQFFGEDGFGAPLTGDFIISLVERMRRSGPPKFKRNAHGRKEAEPPLLRK